MQKILLTGANGFIGFYLIKQLLHHRFQVLATGKGPCRLPFTDSHFRYLSLDFTDPFLVESVLTAEKPDVVIHSGAISKPDDCEQHPERAYLNNVTGTQNLLDAASRLGCSFHFISTDFVFAGSKEQYCEEDLPDPVNYYGQTKMLAEAGVRLYPFPWSIIRPVLVYGKPQVGRGNLLTMVADSLRAGKPLKIFKDQVRTPTYVEDLAEAIARIVIRRRRGIYHISGKEAQTPYDMAMEVARHLKLEENLIEPVTEHSFHQPARRPPCTIFNLEKARRELDYEPLSFAEGLHRTFEE